MDSLYASGPKASSRPELWNSLLILDAPLIVLGDFSMVEHLEDRFNSHKEFRRSSSKSLSEKL